MLLLFREDEPQGGNRGGIPAVERRNLRMKVAQNHPLDRNGGRGDRLATEKTGDEPEDRPSKPAQVITAAPRDTSRVELGQEAGPVALLMVAEVSELVDEIGCAPASGGDLRGIDADGAMLPGMIDLHHAVGKAFT